MDTQQFIKSWPALWLWMQYLSKTLVGTALSEGYTFRKGRLDLHFRKSGSFHRLAWQKQGNQALLTLSEQDSLPKKRVDLFRDIASSARISGIQVHALDRLIRLNFSDHTYLLFGFFPGSLNVYHFKSDSLSDTFLKDTKTLYMSSDWLGPEDQLPVHIPGNQLTVGELKTAKNGLSIDPSGGKLLYGEQEGPVYNISQFVIEVIKRNRSSRQSPGVSIKKTGNTVLKRWKNKLKKINQELLQAKTWPDLEIQLQGLQMALGMGLPIKLGEIELTGETSPTGEPISIKVPSGATLQNSIESTAKKIRKYKGKLVQLEEIIPNINDDIQSLSKLLDSDDSEAIQIFLKQHGELIDQRGKIQTERTPYKKYSSPSGFDILVGRGSKDNDALTFKVANKHDWWFHARQIRGSHVILRTGNQVPQQADIFKAAEYAAKNSKAKHSGIVVVQYCQRKHLSKPKGSPPGAVLVHHEKSVTIDLDRVAEK